VKCGKEGAQIHKASDKAIWKGKKGKKTLHDAAPRELLFTDQASQGKERGVGRQM